MGEWGRAVITIEKLISFGADVNEGLKRCMNNEAFYLRLVGMEMGDRNFDALKDAVEAGDPKAAFEAAHALKGALGNLSLTPIYEPVALLTEELRGASSMPDVGELCQRVFSAYQQLKSLSEE